MVKIYRLVFSQPDPEEADRQTLGLASIAIVLFLLVTSLAIFKQLHRIGHVEDCMMQGRNNCDVLLTRLR